MAGTNEGAKKDKRRKAALKAWKTRRKASGS